jgi:heterodisulfide reductase subunit A
VLLLWKSIPDGALPTGVINNENCVLMSISENGYRFTEKVHPDTLVIGAGIAGIQTSLEIANAGYKVYLVEQSGTIGGHMAMFDKTFPTLDCAACILTPKMVEVGQHKLIELFTCSEVKEVSGSPGAFRVKVLKKARFVDQHLCIGCGSCAAKCPGKAPSEFDAGTSLRKAIYIPFPQAVPNKYLIDPKSCLYMQSDGKKCGVCVKFCPVNDCIDLHAKDEELEIEVGNIVVATGFKAFDATKVDRYGYGKLPNVLTSIELERLINAGGPTEGKITFRTQDKKGNWVFSSESGQPKNVAIIHCVGSRDENYNAYCSKVCCMYSLKLAHLVKEKLPYASVIEYFIDMRAFGKGYEEFYQRIKNEGVHMIRGKTAKITEKDNKMVLRSEDILNNRLIEQEADMVILAVGLEPSEGVQNIADLLDVKLDVYNWFQESNALSDPVGTVKQGVTLAGVCQGPKDIPDTVAQASAAASRVLQSIEMYKKVETI